MKRSRICTGSRSVVPTAGLLSMRAAIRLGPPPLSAAATRRSKSSSSAAQALLAIPAPRAMATRSAVAALARRLRAGDLVDAVVPHHDREILRRPLGDGGEAAELHQQRAVAFERDHMPLRLRDGDAERDRDGETHAAEHVEILRALAARPQIEIGVADAADHRFVALELADQPLGQVEAVHHLGVVGADGSGLIAVMALSLEHFAAGQQRREDEGDRRLRRHRLLDRAVEDEGEFVLARDGDDFRRRANRAPAAWSCTPWPGRD